MYILPFTFFGSLLHSREVSSTTFCIVVIYCTLFQGYTWVLGRWRAGGKFKSHPVRILTFGL